MPLGIRDRSLRRFSCYTELMVEGIVGIGTAMITDVYIINHSGESDYFKCSLSQK